MSRLQHLAHVNLSSNALAEFPKDLCSLPIVELSVSRNRNRESLAQLGPLVLPEEIGQLTTLQLLRADSNLMAAVPSSIGKLTALVELYLQGNRLLEVRDKTNMWLARTPLCDSWQATFVWLPSSAFAVYVFRAPV